MSGRTARVNAREQADRSLTILYEADVCREWASSLSTKLDNIFGKMGELHFEAGALSKKELATIQLSLQKAAKALQPIAAVVKRYEG
jgi:hypothetical protein